MQYISYLSLSYDSFLHWASDAHVKITHDMRYNSNKSSDHKVMAGQLKPKGNFDISLEAPTRSSTLSNPNPKPKPNPNLTLTLKLNLLDLNPNAKPNPNSRPMNSSTLFYII